MTIRNQRGLSLSSLLVWSVLLILLAIAIMKLTPIFMEYSTIRKHIATLAQNANAQNHDANAIRLSFNKRAQIDNIQSIGGKDIDIFRQDNRIVLSTQYKKTIPLIPNVSLVIDFEATSE